MTEASETTPRGVSAAGLRSLAVASDVDGAVASLRMAIEDAGATVFAVVDHSGEAAKVGLHLRPTKLMIFGNPRGGTPVMQSAPLSAIDLPLKLLVWEDDAGSTWISYVDADWLSERYGVPPDLAGPLRASELLAKKVAR